MNVELLEQLANASCGVALFSFTIIATASRDSRLETFVQWTVSISAGLAALLLLGIAIEGGEFWGSRNLVMPLVTLCIIIAFASRMNLRGEQISQGMNPHQIRNIGEEE